MAKKKKYIVLARNGRIQTKGLTTGKGHRTFGEKSAMWISDPAEAREIETQYGMKGSKEVAVTTDQQYEWSVNNEGGNGTKLNNVHNYTFFRMGLREKMYDFASDPNYEFIGGAWKPKRSAQRRRISAEVRHGV